MDVGVLEPEAAVACEAGAPAVSGTVDDDALPQAMSMAPVTPKAPIRESHRCLP
jgi:hypothetical protein